MIFGKSVIELLLAGFIGVCLFFLAQWIIPLLFGLVGLDMPLHIVNIFAILIAIGVFYGIGWRRGGSA